MLQREADASAGSASIAVGPTNRCTEAILLHEFLITLVLERQTPCLGHTSHLQQDPSLDLGVLNGGPPLGMLAVVTGAWFIVLCLLTSLGECTGQ